MSLLPIPLAVIPPSRGWYSARATEHPSRAAVTAAAIPPGTAALFLLIRKVTADKVLEGLRGEGGTVMRTSLDHTKEAALQAALAGVQAAVPATASNGAVS